MKILPLASFFMENLETKGINQTVKGWHRKVYYVLLNSYICSHNYLVVENVWNLLALGDSSSYDHALGNDGKVYDRCVI